MLGQSPPTTSGIVVLSGSNNFGLTGDFPVFASVQVDHGADAPRFDSPIDLASSLSADEIVTPAVLATVNTHEVEQFLSSPLRLAASITANESVSPPVLDVKAHLEDARTQIFLQFVPFGNDSKITSTPVTTSGIVILEFYPGVNVSGGPPPYVPPIFLNERIFPVTFSGLGERLFPEENRRIYPVLPQFSTLNPGG